MDMQTVVAKLEKKWKGNPYTCSLNHLQNMPISFAGCSQSPTASKPQLQMSKSGPIPAFIKLEDDFLADMWPKIAIRCGRKSDSLRAQIPIS